MDTDFTLEATGADIGFTKEHDWVYRDLPNMLPEFMDKFIDIVGEENIRWITFAERTWRGEETTQRGQLLVSPEGLKRIKAYNNGTYHGQEL